jgi:hypothetical protein
MENIDENKFCLIIRSIDKLIATENTNDCLIIPKSPSQYKKLHCKILNFYIDKTIDQTFNSLLVELQSDLNINNFDTRNANMKCLSFYDFNSHTSSLNISFETNNFNCKPIRFRLVDSNNQLFTKVIGGVTSNYNDNWICVMECTGIF